MNVILLFLILSARGLLCIHPYHSYPRVGRTANLMTVHVTNKTCSHSNLVRSLTTPDTITSCHAVCRQEVQCLAFTFVVQQDSRECFLFSSCPVTIDLHQNDTSSITGLLPGKHVAVERTRMTQPNNRRYENKSARALRYYNEDGKELHRAEEYTYSQTDNSSYPQCNRLLYRSCPILARAEFPIVYRYGLQECLSFCKQSSGCVGVTYYRQGGGGWFSSGPCIRHRECDLKRSLWCDNCVTLIIEGCHASETDNDLHTGDAQVSEEAVLLLGGFALDHVHNIEIVSDHGECHHRVQDMPVPRSRSVVGTLGDNVHVCGGRTQYGQHTASCSVLDLATGAWAPGHGMHHGREDAGAAVLGGDTGDTSMMLVTGGWDGDTLLDSVEMMTTDSGGWQEVGGWRLTTPRYQHCSVAYGDSAIITGGYPTLTHVEILSLGDGEWRGWTQLTPLRSGRVSHACVVTTIGSRPVLIVSGGQYNGNLLSSVEALTLDSEDAEWFSLPDMLRSRRNHIMTIMSDSLLLIGGDTVAHQPMRGFYYQLVAEVESLNIFNEESVFQSNWKINGVLITPRTLLSHVVIKNMSCI